MNITKFGQRAACSVVLSLCGAAYVNADSMGQVPQPVLKSPVASLAFPSIFGVPTAVAAKNGTSFVGISLVDQRGGVSGAGPDGDFVAGYSMGNPLDSVSLTFGLAVTGLSPFGDAGSLSVTANRLIHAGGKSALFLGASASNLMAWGASADRNEMLSAFASNLTTFGVGAVEVPVQITAGYGTDNTRSTDGSGTMTDGVFVGVGVGVTNLVSLGLSATETQLNIGAAVNFPGTGLSATLGLLDVTDNTNLRQFSLSTAYSF